MANVRFSLYCSSRERDTGQGWKMSREALPEAIALLLRCINGRWRGEPAWEINAYALDHSSGLQVDFTGMNWTNEQRKWFERHMKKLMEGTRDENVCA